MLRLMFAFSVTREPNHHQISFKSNKTAYIDGGLVPFRHIIEISSMACFWFLCCQTVLIFVSVNREPNHHHISFKSDKTAHIDGGLVPFRHIHEISSMACFWFLCCQKLHFFFLFRSPGNQTTIVSASNQTKQLIDGGLVPFRHINEISSMACFWFLCCQKLY